MKQIYIFQLHQLITLKLLEALMAHILIYVTNHAYLGETQEANGTYAPELTHALHEFLNAGHTYDIASIKGGVAPLYGRDTKDDPVNADILAEASFQEKITKTIKASDLDISRYDAVFYPGGFGLLTDLAVDEAVAQQTAAIYERGGIVGAVCHGPAGLLPVTLSTGEALISNKAVTGFTREEEVDFGTINKIPYLLEESLARTAKSYSKTQPWGVHVIKEDRLITGQNPASAGPVGAAMNTRLAS